MEEHESKCAAGHYAPFRPLSLSERLHSMECMLAKLAQGITVGNKADTLLDTAELQRLQLAIQSQVAERAEFQHTAADLTLQDIIGMPGRLA